MTSVELRDLPNSMQRKLPKYAKVPAVLLGRLAVGIEHRGKRFGRFLLMDALKRSLAGEVAWAVVLVDAKDEDAARFYTKYGFQRFSDRPDRLFLPRKTAEQTFP
jgi:predicted GNAT family N-acyltransferase